MSVKASGDRRSTIFPILAAVLLASAPAGPLHGAESSEPRPTESQPVLGPVPSTLPPDPGGDREAVLPPTLSPSAQTGADARSLYALAIRRELALGPSAALPLYLQVLDKDPSFVDLYLKASLDYVQDRRTDAADKLLRVGIAANPSSADLYAGLAYLRQAAGKQSDAFELAQKAKALAPFNNLAHRIAFESLRDQGKAEAALDLARAAAKASPAQATQDEWTALAHLYTELVCAGGAYSQAQVAWAVLPLYDRAFALGFPGASLLRQRGDLSLYLDRKDEAYDFLKRAAAQSDPDAALLMRLANLASDLAKPDEALADYEQAYALEPEFPQLREVLAMRYVQIHQEDKAAALLEETAKREPNRPDLYAALGDLYAQSGKLDKAEACYRRMLAAAGKQAQAPDYLKLAMVLLRENRPGDAEATVHEAQGRYPDAARLAFFDGIVQRELKRPEKALASFAQARLLARDKEEELLGADYYYELSLAQGQAGQAASSENSLKLGLALEPHNGNLLNALAYCWADADRNLPQALKYSQEALAAAPDRGEFADTLGWVYYRLGKYDQAAALLQHAVVLTREDPVVLGHLADAYLQMGRRDEAGQALHKLVEKDPANAEARKKLENFLSGPQVASTKNEAKP